MQALKHCSKKSHIPGLSQNETHIFEKFTENSKHPWHLTNKYSGFNPLGLGLGGWLLLEALMIPGYRGLPEAVGNVARERQLLEGRQSGSCVLFF